SYWPRLDKVGKTSEKIFLADGGRYLPYAVGVSFTEDWKVVAEEGGEYADWGADSYYTHAQSRADCAAAIANIPGATLSPIPVRNLWARHGPLKHGVLANEYKFNAVFYDGHVETLGDLQGANPIYWMPKGTVVSAQEFWGDVYKQYDIPSGLYICPE
ncbi:MAG TPA: hypothetical protein VL992_07940, partial [Tepidisphaeraceae bacterium]|nr:hypothetical protein [Tepidisphaeraceae bacterium]